MPSPVPPVPSPVPLVPSPPIVSAEVQTETVTKFEFENIAMNINASLNQFMDSLSSKLDQSPPPPPPNTSMIPPSAAAAPPNYQQLYIDSLLRQIGSLEHTISNQELIIANQHAEMMLLMESTAPLECMPASPRPLGAPSPQAPAANAPSAKAPTTTPPATKVPAAKAPAAKSPPVARTHKHSSVTSTSPSPKRVEIIGDSMLGGIHPWSKPGFFAKVNSFSGATTTDMLNMTDIAMRRDPDMLIIHSGTNDFGHNVQTKKELQRVISKSRNINPDIIIGISAICYREDDRRLQPKIKDMNNQLKNLSRQLQVKFIEHDDFDSACLAKKGLHPNENGNVSIKADFDRTIQSSLA